MDDSTSRSEPSYTHSSVDEVVGIDLGHGETSAARISLTSNAPPQMLQILGKSSQITAVAALPDGTLVIGERAVQSRQVSRQRVGFKVRPPGTRESRQAITDYVRQYTAELTHQILGGGRTHYFVGYPSAWSDQEAATYGELLRTVLQNVSMVRESRAALVEAKESGRLSPNQLRGSILVIDMGSSTTDVSYVLGGIHDHGLDTGTEIGSHLIEKEILRRAVERSSRRSEILRFFRGPDGDAHRRVCEAHCREAKERYWELGEVAAKEGRRSVIPIGKEGLGDLEVHLDGEEMESILAAPLPELKGYSWKQSLAVFFGDIWSLAAARSVVPQTVILTGGASNMSFVPALCERSFPEAKLVWCTPPEETVALGLARWGRIQLQTNAFATTVRELCQATVPAIVEKRSEALRNAMANDLARAAVIDVVNPTVRAWRAGELDTLETMDKVIRERMANWIQSPASVAAMKRAYTPILDSINHEVDLQTSEICMKYGVPRSSLLFTLEVSVNGEQLELPMGGSLNNALGSARFVSSGAVIVITVIAKQVLVAAAAAGPEGWLLLALVAAISMFIGGGVLAAKMTDINFPGPVRRAVLSETKVAKLMDTATAQLRDKLHAALSDSEMARIRAELADQVSTFLLKRADEVKWIIT
jgi:hypothetical protein